MYRKIEKFPRNAFSIFSIHTMESNTHSQSCPICLEDLSKVKRIVLTFPCGNRYCRKCIIEYIKKDGTNEHFVCPSCRKTHSLDEFPKTVQKKYDEQRKRLKRIRDGKLKCPRTGCKGYIKDASCESCSYRLCLTCFEDEHSPTLCDASIVKSVRFITANTKTCPQCKAPIIKNGGCDHMTCKRCNHNFSWSKMTSLDKNFQPTMTQSPIRFGHLNQDTFPGNSFIPPFVHYTSSQIDAIRELNRWDRKKPWDVRERIHSDKSIEESEASLIDDESSNTLNRFLTLSEEYCDSPSNVTLMEMIEISQDAKLDDSMTIIMKDLLRNIAEGGITDPETSMMILSIIQDV